MGSVGPLQTTVYVDPLLSNVSIAYINEAFVSDTLMPTIEVKKRTGIYYEYNKDNLRVVDDLRAPGTRANRVQYGLTQRTYGPIVEHALELSIPDEDREEAMDPLDLDTDGTENLTERILLSKEKDLNTLLTTAGTGYTNSAEGYTTLSGTSQWSDLANSDPIGVIKTAKDKVKKRIMKKPNTLFMGYEVFSMLRDHPQILERIKYSQFGVITADIMAKVFDIEKIIVGDAEENTANETATDSLSYIWGKHVWLMYITPRPGLKSVSYGYTLRKMEKSGQPRRVDRWREEEAKSDVIRVSDAYQHKVMAIEAIFRIVNAIA